MRFAVLGRAAEHRPDIERRVRPGRLGEILDDAGDVVVAFDQKHVPGLERLPQRLGIARRERLEAAHRLLQVTGDQPAHAVKQSVHAGLPPLAREFFSQLVLLPRV
jgi:hypothetical protein